MTDSRCAAHHCDRADCQDRTHVYTYRCLPSLVAAVEAKAARRGLDRNTGIVAALTAWAGDAT